MHADKAARLHRIALPLLALLLAAPAHAADDAAMTAIADEMGGLYSSFCLGAFPDGNAVAALAKEKLGRPLAPNELDRYLRGDPGRGWLITTQNGPYLVTVEDPPYRTCAVRRMTPSGLSSTGRYVTAVQNYARFHGGTLSEVDENSARTPDGADIHTYNNTLRIKGESLSELFMLVLTNYHGQAPREWKDEAAGGDGVEVRMVHTLVFK